MKEILNESNMLLDCSFIDSSENGDYVYIFKKLANIETLKSNIEQSDIELYHQLREWFEECIEGDRIDLEAVAVFENL